MIKSLRVRLLLWYTAVLTGVVGGFAGLLYVEVRSARYRGIDAELETGTASLEASLRTYPPFVLESEKAEPPPPPFREPRRPPPGGPGPKGPPRGQPGFGPGPDQPPPWGEPPFREPPLGPPPPRERRPLPELVLPGSLNAPDRSADAAYFAVWRADGSLLKAHGLQPDTPAPSLPQAKPNGATLGLNRELTLRGPHGSSILVGRPIGPVIEELRAFAWRLAFIGFGVLGVGLLGGWLISRRIFRPIDQIAATASRISATNLTERIETEHVDAELAELAAVLNEAFDRLHEAFDRQTRFTADASHELRTPLAVIRSKAQLALARPRTSEEYRQALEVCLQSASRMSELVERLLTLARTDAGESEFRREPVLLDRVAADAANQLTAFANERGVRVELDVLTASVTGDATALGQVASNLIGNALRYNRAGGSVRVTVAIVGDNAEFAVADTGIGIPVDELPRVFERFYRADKARARVSGGTGLGLAICKSIIEAHGGRIEVESHEGQGSTFRVKLPRLAAALPAGREKPQLYVESPTTEVDMRAM